MSAANAGMPARLRDHIAMLLEVPATELRLQQVGGGCISPAARVDAGDRTVFVKWSDPDAAGPAGRVPAGLFHDEAASLEALRAAASVRVPAVLDVTDHALVLEWLEPGSARRDAWRGLGAGVARLHRMQAPAYGWECDNHIGALPQANGWMDDWPRFFRERRILPQLELALRAGLFDARGRKQLDAFVAELERILTGTAEDGASLLHGDLWSGNAHALRTGDIALIDPSSYYGHREIDLAMAELFGGFPEAFFNSYEADWPTTPVGRMQRRSAYRVYYLLVHVNLFGRGYVGGTLEAARTALT